MAEERGFLVGQSLREKLKSTIAKVDGIAPGGPVSRIPTVIESPHQATAGKVFRICEFTGTWAVNAEKTLTFRGVTSTPNTVLCQNVFTSLPDRGTSTVAIAKDGTAWHLIQWQPVTATASVLTSVSLGTAGLRFTSMNIRFQETVSTSLVTIATTACS